MYRCIIFNNFITHGIILIIPGLIFDYGINVDSKGLRVFDGQDADAGKYPYIVALFLKNRNELNIEKYRYFCTGSAITPTWTLTAGHCISVTKSKIMNTRIHKLVIRYVIETDNITWYTSDIVDTMLHPNYKLRQNMKKSKYVKNDIALVKTEKTLISEFGRLSTVDYRTMFGHKVTAAGYGRMNTEEGTVGNTIKLNNSLQAFDAVIIKCNDHHVRNLVHPSFCLAWECEYPSTTCPGDSGAPIIHPTGIIAVNSAGTNRDCRRERLYASISTPISPFLDWITNNIRTL